MTSSSRTSSPWWREPKEYGRAAAAAHAEQWQRGTRLRCGGAIKAAWRHVPALILLAGLLGASWDAHAADELPASESVSYPSGTSPSRWTYDVESAYVFWNIQNPFWLLAGRRGQANDPKNPWDYHLNTYLFGGRYDLSTIRGWGFLRGYWQSSVGIVASDILKGPEHYYAGLMGGLRYVFVPGDGTWTPYFEFREGVGATDASHIWFGQQSDLSFMYLLGVGVRYQPAPKWRISLGLVDQHMSNAYLTKENFGFDSAGFIIALEWRP